MTDELPRGDALAALDRKTREKAEGDLAFARVNQLRESPIRGKFDLAHLAAIHGYIFQDVPSHKPGEVRDDTLGWSKNRKLEGQEGYYEVQYKPTNVQNSIERILSDFGGPAGLRGLSQEEAAVKLAKLYGDLDYAHGFYEGNSRTLRKFTTDLAQAAGFFLDWSSTDQTAASRNYLYIARDIEVISRAYPGLSSQMANHANAYEAALQIEHFIEKFGAHPLEKIIASRLTPVVTMSITDKVTANLNHYWSSAMEKVSGAVKASSADLTRTSTAYVKPRR